MDKMAKITVSGQEVKECPKCKTDDSMYAVTELKWGKQDAWQHFARCESCGYETRAK